MTVTQDIWEGCYRGGWGDLLGQSSMAHPAKMARGLAARIYEHVLEEQWIQAGGRVVDPFGGIAGTAFHAMVHGLVWQGVELEPRFVAWGQGMDCDGTSCPQCAKEIKASEQQTQMFERAPHRFAGNIETWEKKGLPGTARLVQGDSRKLREVLNNADLSVASPPYGQRTVHGQAGIDFSRSELRDRTGSGGQVDTQDRYGEEDGNLGNMPMSDHELVVSSPPYISGGHHTDVMGGRGADRAEGNLEVMPADDYEASITSPPYEHDSEPHGDLRPDNGSQAAVFVERDYGATDGNLSAKPETFWSASRTILEQLFDILKPGGHAVFVTGDFVRDRRRVRFGEQWRQLCEAVGFVCLHHHIASKTDARGTQGLLDGGEIEQQSSKISFFRRNHIDNERAAIHWSLIENQTDYLTQAETKLRKEYDKRVAAKKSAVPVTEARILQVAQKTAWREGGAPAHDTDIAILNEDVWCFLRP